MAYNVLAVTDVPAHLMKLCAAKRWAGMWVKEAWEQAEGDRPSRLNPEPPQRRSCYRPVMRSDGVSSLIRFVFL